VVRGGAGTGSALWGAAPVRGAGVETAPVHGPPRARAARDLSPRFPPGTRPHSSPQFRRRGRPVKVPVEGREHFGSRDLANTKPTHLPKPFVEFVSEADARPVPAPPAQPVPARPCDPQATRPLAGRERGRERNLSPRRTRDLMDVSPVPAGRVARHRKAEPVPAISRDLLDEPCTVSTFPPVSPPGDPHPSATCPCVTCVNPV
jgi:hypothetical protein